ASAASGAFLSDTPPTFRERRHRSLARRSWMRAPYSVALEVGSPSSLEAKACGPHVRTAALASSSFTNIRRAKQRLQYFSQLKHFSANRRSLTSCGVSLSSNAAMFGAMRPHSLRQDLANAAIAASRVTSLACRLEPWCAAGI